MGSEIVGGLRDPSSFWDFFDVYAGAQLARDSSITIGDIIGVVSRFGSGRAEPLTEEEALAEATTLPPAAPAYHSAFDRGGADPEGNRWDLFPPGGNIVIGDIIAVVAQFGHICA